MAEGKKPRLRGYRPKGPHRLIKVQCPLCLMTTRATWWEKLSPTTEPSVFIQQITSEGRGKINNEMLDAPEETISKYRRIVFAHARDLVARLSSK